MSQLSFGDDFGLEVDDGGDPTYSVSEVAEAVNGALRSRFFDGLWVRGEIQGYSVRGPHAYFRLVEDGDEGKAVLNVQFFAPAQNRLRPVLAKHRLRLADGLKVRIFGHLDFFAGSGQLGLKMSGIDPRFTLGDLAQQRTEVVRRLVASGLYDANRRLALPVAPLRVGVVASLDSAAWADFRHELESSEIGFQVRVANVRVQGEWAVEEISAALVAFGRRLDLDVIVVIRGGGARSELATFDHEQIATAIATSALPVFTGLGHETDSAVADEVAHRSLKTPTACAAALVETVQAFRARSELAWQAIERTVTRSVERADQRLADAARRIQQRTVAAVERAGERLDQRTHRLGRGVQRSVELAERTMTVASAALGRVPARLVGEDRLLDGVEARVRLLDPVNTLARGWSITRTADGRIVRDASVLAAGQRIVTTFAAGSAISTIEETIT